MKHKVLGALQPTVVNTVGLATRFSGRYPIKFDPTRVKELSSEGLWPLSRIEDATDGGGFTFGVKVTDTRSESSRSWPAIPQVMKTISQDFLSAPSCETFCTS